MGIFISYRRGITQDIVGRIRDRLALRFGDVFLDLASLELGAEFDPATMAVLSRANVMLVVIGPDWARDGALHSPADWVRRELEMVLYRPGVRVIPVLVLGARLPAPDDLPPSLRPLLQRQALAIDSGVDFGDHLRRLEHVIRAHVRPSWIRPVAVACGSLVLAGSALTGWMYFRSPDPGAVVQREQEEAKAPIAQGGAAGAGAVGEQGSTSGPPGPPGSGAPSGPPPDAGTALQADEPAAAGGSRPAPKRDCRRGETTTENCGDCGTRSRTCKANGTWERFGACTGVSTKRHSEPCGNCGTKTRECLSDGMWGPFGDCGSGECSPGATRNMPCGLCGTRKDSCSAACVWQQGSCTNQGVCTPGQREPCGNTHQTCTRGTRTCTSGCQWGGCVGALCPDFPVHTANSDRRCGPNMMSTSVCTEDISATCPAGSAPTGQCSAVDNFGGRGTCELIGVSVNGQSSVARIRIEVGATQGTGCRVDQCYCRYPAL